MTSIIDINSLDEWKQLLKFHKNIILLASADWCSPCKKLYPHYKTFSESKEFKDQLLFTIFDVDEVEDLHDELEITGMPSLFFFRDQKQIDTQVGANLEILTSFIQKNHK
jgi:thioredoxin 1